MVVRAVEGHHGWIAAPSGAREVPRYIPGPGRLAGIAVDRSAAVPDGPGVPARGSDAGRPLCLDPENDIEVAVDGRVLTIRAERRQQDNGPYRSEFRYGSLARTVRLPARVDAGDVTARYDKGVLEVSVPVPVVRPEGIRIPVEDAEAMPEQPPDQSG
jgi:hypothetical protein